MLNSANASLSAFVFTLRVAPDAGVAVSLFLVGSEGIPRTTPPPPYLLGFSIGPGEAKFSRFSFLAALRARILPLALLKLLFLNLS